MNKKLKRIIATVSAMVTCAVGMVSVSAGAVLERNPFKDITPYTLSFKIKDVKYNVWQEMNDYFNNDEKHKFFISEDGEHMILLSDGHYIFTESYIGWDRYVINEKDAFLFEKYLSDNNIGYTKENGIPLHDNVNDIFIERYTFNITGSHSLLDKEYFSILQKIKDNTGFSQGLIMCDIFLHIQATDIKIELPEPTLLGDANEDGVVNISDAVLIMQSISNPHAYQLSIQGMANADIVDNDGVTLLDALRIQEMSAGL